MRSWLVAVLGVLVLFLIQGAADFGLEVPALATFLSLLLGLGSGVAGEAAPLAQPVAQAPRRSSRPGATPTGQAKADVGTALASGHVFQRGCVT